MSFDWTTAPEIHEAIRLWFDRWGGYVAAENFAAARDLFDENVAGFGTHMDVVEGLEDLEAAQWCQVWPTIRDFRFSTEALKVGVADDRLMVIGLCTWTSTGLHQDGSTFDRPGRATVVLVRAGLDAPWRGIHTHFSLNPGTPAKSYGNR